MSVQYTNYCLHPRYCPISLSVQLVGVYLRWSFCFLVAVLFCHQITLAQAITPAEIAATREVSFQHDVLPLFESKCLACHHSGEASGRLNLEDETSIMRGGKGGAVLVPGKPDDSVIYRLAARLHNPAMPPLPNKASATALTPEEVGLLRKWILSGARFDGGSAKVINWRSIPDQHQPILALGLSPQGRFVACGRGNQLDIYDLILGEHVARPVDSELVQFQHDGKPLYPQGAAHVDDIHAITYSPTEDRIATSGYREIKLWSRQGPTATHTITMKEPVSAVAVAPKAQQYAAANIHDFKIEVRGTRQNDVLAELSGHTARVSQLLFDPLEPRLVSLSSDRTVRIWNLSDQRIECWAEFPANVLSAVLADEGRLLVTADHDQLVRVWSLKSLREETRNKEQPTHNWKPVREIRVAGGPVTVMTISSGQAQHLVTGAADGKVCVVEFQEGKIVSQWNVGGAVTALAFSDDAKRLAVSAGPSIKLFQTDGKQLAEATEDPRVRQAIVAAEDQLQIAKSRQALAKAALDQAVGTIKEREEGEKKSQEAVEATQKKRKAAEEALETANNALQKAISALNEMPDDEARKKAKRDAEAPVTKAEEALKKEQDAVTSAERSVVSAAELTKLAKERHHLANSKFEAEQNRLKEKETALEETRKKPVALGANITGLRFDQLSKRLASLSDDGVLRTWHPHTLQPLDVVPTNRPGRLQVSEGAPGLWVQHDDSVLTCWNTESTWKLDRAIGPAETDRTDLSHSPFVDRVTALAFNSEGTLLAAGGGEPSRTGELVILNATTGQTLNSFPEIHSDVLGGVEFSPDGTRLATCSSDKFVKIVDLQSGKVLRSFEGHTGAVMDVTWRADEGFLASSGADNLIKIWNLETGEQHRSISNYGKQVASISFIGTTDNLISGSGDRSVKLHRAGDGANYRTFGNATEFVNAVGILRDEQIAVAGTSNGILWIWNGQKGQVLFQFDPPAKKVAP